METEAEALNGEATDSRRMEVQIGGAVTLECDGGCWGHGPGMDPVGGPGPLALSRVVYQEAGEYRCVAPDRKMQDTWRAQLPYHIKITGESDKIFTEVECHWLVDVSLPIFSLARGRRSRISRPRVRKEQFFRPWVRAKWQKLSETRLDELHTSTSYKLYCDSRDVGNARDILLPRLVSDEHNIVQCVALCSAAL